MGLLQLMPAHSAAFATPSCSRTCSRSRCSFFSSFFISCAILSRWLASCREEGTPLAAPLTLDPLALPNLQQRLGWRAHVSQPPKRGSSAQQQQGPAKLASVPSAFSSRPCHVSR